MKHESDIAAAVVGFGEIRESRMLSLSSAIADSRDYSCLAGGEVEEGKLASEADAVRQLAMRTAVRMIAARLSEGSEAQVWLGEDCSRGTTASHTISDSGAYEIPLSTLPGTGRMVCLLSAADGLADAVSLRGRPLPANREK